MLRGSRVIGPSPGRKEILQELHETHPGISRMKSLSRCFIWWQHMDSEIQDLEQWSAVHFAKNHDQHHQ